MSATRIAIACSALALYCASASASFINATYSWTGNKGWIASGSIRYDDSILYPAAAGPSWGTLNTGIEYLDLSIYDAAGLLKGSWVQILNSVVQYNTLRITLDTSGPVDVLASGSKLDLGITTDTTRPDYWGGTVGPSKNLVIGWNRVLADSGPSAVGFTLIPDPPPEDVSAPGAAPLVLFGLLGVVASRARGRRYA